MNTNEETAESSHTQVIAKSTELRSTHPLYIHPSDNPGMHIISHILTENNFAVWSRAMRIALSAKNKLCIVSGSYPKPTDNSPLIEEWTRCNDMVIAWLTNSLSKDIYDSVLFCSTAAQIWKDLRHRYSQRNRAKKFEVRREIALATQGTMSISSYYMKLKTLWDEMVNLNKKAVCVCEAAKVFVEEEDENKLFQFLMGLNESYIGTRGQILFMVPLPHVDQAYNMLLQEERQRQFNYGQHVVPEPIALVAGRSNQGSNTGKNKKYFAKKEGEKRASNEICDFCSNPGHTKDGCFKLHGFVCEFCKTPGHTKVMCYKLKGYPAQREIKGRVHSVQQVETDQPKEDSDAHSTLSQFTQDQYQKLIALLNNSQVSEHKIYLAGRSVFVKD